MRPLLLKRSALSLQIVKGFFPGILCHAFELIFDPHKLVVLADPIGTAHGTGFDLPGFQGHHQVRDKAVFRLAGTVEMTAVYPARFAISTAS